MKQLFLILVFSFPVLLAKAQDWNFVGTSEYNASEVDIEITPGGNLFMAYIDTDNGNKATVRRFVNGSWDVVGTPGFSGSGSSSIQLVMTSETNPAIVVKRPTFLLEYLEVYRWSGTAWIALNVGDDIWTQYQYPYSLRANDAGTLFLTYFNNDVQAHEVGVITVNLTTHEQLGNATVNQWADVYAFSSYAGAGNDVRTAINELADMDYGSTIRYLNGGTWDQSGFDFGERASAIKMEKGINTSNYCMTWQTADNDLKFCAAALALNVGSHLTISASNGVSDFDFDTQNDNAFVFYRDGAICNFKQITSTMAPTQTLITTGTALAPNGATSLAAETYNGNHVIAYVSNGKCYVKEYNVDANIEDFALFEMCEGTFFSNNGNIAVYCLDPNYEHANVTMTCTSMNTAVIPQSAITVTGSALNWYISIGTTNDVAVNTVVDLVWQLFENGVMVDQVSTPVHVNANPGITFAFNQSSLCENEPAFSLVNKASPIGGTWSGTGVSNNQFNPGQFDPTPSVTSYLHYTKTSAQGCTTKDSTLVTINQVPELSLTIVNADCGQTNGSAAASIAGGSAPYSTYWSNGSTFTSVGNLAPGQYYVNVEDNNGCSVVGSVPVGSSTLTLTGSATHVSCNGTTTGAVNLTVNGTAPFTFAWSNGATTEDISTLAAGPYEVLVTDASGCVSTASFTVFQPAALVLANKVIANPECEDTDGGITVTYTGGSQPYNYSWTDQTNATIGSNAVTLSGIGAGYYTSTVTDAAGCSRSFPILVSNNGGPLIAIDTIINSSCAADGEVQLTNISNSAQQFLWNTGATTQDISGLAPGTYIIQATNGNVCTTVLSATVGSLLPEAVEICLLTVDTLTNTNLVVWEKPVTNGIDHFNIYRETSQAGLYQLAGSVNYADESLYNDLVASPSVRSWRYKISSVDACGVESELSIHHKTIHLTIGLGLGSSINLSWDSYEGFVFPQFVLKRHTNVDGWQTIQTMPTNLFTYTDTPPTTSGLLYLVTIDPPAICSTTKSAQDFNSSRSNKDNRFSAAPSTNSLNEILASGMQVYPNPSNGNFTIENKAGVLVKAAVLDASGRLLKTMDVPSGTIQVDLGFLADGIYQVVFSNEIARATQKLTIQH